MSDILKGEKGLVSIRIVDEEVVLTGSGEEDWERVEVSEARIGLFAPYQWSVGSRYEIQFAPDPYGGGGEHVIRVVDDEVAHHYDPFDFSGAAPEIQGRTMIEELVVIGRGDKAPQAKSAKAKKILEWVGTYGLLENDPIPSTIGRGRPGIKITGLSRVRHREISLEGFWLFAKDVRDILALAFEIRRGRIDKIDERGRELRDNPKPRRLSDIEEYIVKWADRTVYDQEQKRWRFKSSDTGLRLSSHFDVLFRKRLKDLTVGVSGGLLGEGIAVVPDSLPTPGGLQLVAGDLKTGIYAEVALVASGAVAVDICQRDGCDHLVVKTKSNKRYCSDSCRSMVNQRRRDEQTS